MEAVFLDVDGVLIPIDNSWAYIHRRLGVEGEAQKHLKQYLEGKISYEEWMKLDTALWIRAAGGRLHRSVLEKLYGEVAIPEESLRSTAKLREAGLKIALLSGGVDLMVSRVARILGIRWWKANRLIFSEEGFLQPGGIAEVEALGKDKALLKLAEEIGVKPAYVAYIGDSHWDLPAFRAAGLSILLWRQRNPPPKNLRSSVNHVARSLLEAVEIITGG